MIAIMMSQTSLETPRILVINCLFLLEKCVRMEIKLFLLVFYHAIKKWLVVEML